MIDFLSGVNARLIIIGGMSRSGKTSLAHEIASSLAAFQVLSLDNYLGGKGYQEVVRKPNGFYTIQQEMALKFNFIKIVSDVKALLAGRSIHISVYDRARRMPAAKPISMRLKDSERLIVEGTPALAIAQLISLPSFKIYLRASIEERKTALFHDWTTVKKLSIEQAKALFSYRREFEEPFIHSTRYSADVLLLRNMSNLFIETI